MGTYLDRRSADEPGLRYDVRRPGSNVTAVVVGTGNLADVTDVRYWGGQATVEVGE